VMLAVAAVLVASVALIACGQQERLSGVLRSPPLDASGISLPATTDGGDRAEMPFAADRGDLLLVYFGFTSCPDVCPTTFADLRSAIGKLPEADRSRVEVAMVTVDPERDTERKMSDYLGFFFDGWRAYRTTDPGELARAEKAFTASHEIGEKDRDGTYEVSHTATVFAVGPGGEVLVEWPFGTSTEVIADDLRLLLEEEDAKQ
jgi:protein SCO1/2